MPTPQARPASRSAAALEQRPDLGPAHQGQRQKGKATPLGHRQGERHVVADAGHRTLHDRVARAVRQRPGASLRPAAGAAAPRRVPSSMARSTAWTIPPTVTNRRASRAAQAASCPAGQTCPGPQPTSASTARRHASRPLGRGRREPPQRGRAGQRVDAEGLAPARSAADQLRLAAIPALEPRPRRRIERRLPRQEQAAVEDHPRRPRRQARRSRPQPDPPADPDRHRRPRPGPPEAG